MRIRFAALAIAGGSLAAAFAAPSLAFAADYPEEDDYGYQEERYERAPVARREIIEEPVEERVVVRRRYVAPPVVVVDPFFVGRPRAYGRWGYYGRPWGPRRRWAHRGRW